MLCRFNLGTNSIWMWLIDLGAIQHMTFSKDFMKNHKKIEPVDLHLSDDGVVQAVEMSGIIMSMRQREE